GRTLPPAAAAMIAAQACAGLHAAHELRDRQGRALRLVHRDVSPSNLFVTYDGHVKVLDFGVAKAHGMETRTETGQVRGKSAYMSPEQSLAQPMDRRSDLFSLGIVLFEMVTMRRLFQRENPLLIYRAICEDPIPTLSEVKPDVPRELERIVRRALERSAGDRYGTAQEMRHDLLAVARKLTSSEPEELIAQTMRDLFAERISEKNALRSGLETGRELEHLPEAETDLGATIPSIGRDPLARGLSPSPRRRSPALVVAVGLAAAGVAGVALTRVSSSGATRSSAEARTQAPTPDPSPAPTPALSASSASELASAAKPNASPPVPATTSSAKRPLRPVDRRPRVSAPAASAPTPPPSARESGPSFHRFD
ncbi:MAG TPA: serine/threonine-protein kinase, partial [Polyangiaceae bacterium]